MKNDEYVSCANIYVPWLKCQHSVSLATMLHLCNNNCLISCLTV